MKTQLLSFAVAAKLLFIPQFVIGQTTAKEQDLLSKSLSVSSGRFTENKGQIADMNGRLCPEVLYKGDGNGADIYLRKTGISYVYSNMVEVEHKADAQVKELIKAGVIPKTDKQKKKDELMNEEIIKLHRVDVDFAGCNGNLSVINKDELEGYQNFYYAHCPDGITHVKQYNEVTYKNIYNNIDVRYHGGPAGGNGIEYDLIVNPHADPNQIKLNWAGARGVHLNDKGNLVIETSVNEFSETMPRVYQIINGKTIDIKANYNLTESNTKNYQITFTLGQYNSDYALIIDPWVTYIGGTSSDHGTGVATDNAGNVVVSGYTSSGNFPVLGGYQMTRASAPDAFAIKFNTSGTRLWATYYGGTGNDWGMGIATDNALNVVMTGVTASGNFPVLNAFQAAISGFNDAFVVKFDANGIRQWATYYGGTGSEADMTLYGSWPLGGGIATDNLGNVVIVGTTGSTDLPVLNGAQMVNGGWFSEVFVAKFSSAGALQWGTYCGGGTSESGFAIATDISNNVVITGMTSSTNFPVLNGFQMTYGGGNNDAFVVKYNSAGTLLWSTFYGGTQDDFYHLAGIATDNGGNVLITGRTGSGNFPVLSGYQMTYGGGGDAFLVKFDSIGTRKWATFYGVTGIEELGSSIVTDGNKNIYLLTEGEDVATPNLNDPCAYQSNFGGADEDQLITKFDPAGNKVCATYLGGTGEDELDDGGGIALYGTSIYITAGTDGGFPVTAGAFQTVYGGGSSDAYLAALCTGICDGKVTALSVASDTNNVCPAVPIKLTPVITNVCSSTTYQYQWTSTGGNPSNSTAPTPTVTYTATGTYTVKLVLITSCKTDSVTKTITIKSCSTTIPHAAFTSSDTVFCDENGKCIDFTDHSTGSPTNWKWTFPGAQPDTSTQQNPTGICYYVPGSYNVTLTVSNSSGKDSLVVVSHIIFGSGASLPIITRKGDTLFCSQEAAYQWYYNGSPIPGATDSFYVALQPGSYNVYITDTYGCSRLGNSIPVSVNELNNLAGIKIYPNPAMNELWVESYGLWIKPTTVEFYNVLGENIYQAELTTSTMADPSFGGQNSQPKTKLDISSLPSGIYFIKVSGNAGALRLVKID